jgi:hypothetical protein
MAEMIQRFHGAVSWQFQLSRRRRKSLSNTVGQRKGSSKQLHRECHQPCAFVSDLTSLCDPGHRPWPVKPGSMNFAIKAR